MKRSLSFRIMVGYVLALLVVPVMGTVVAAFMLGEPLGMPEVLAMALTLAGVALALRKPKSAMPGVE